MPVPGLRDKEPHQKLKSLVFGKFRNFGEVRNFEKLRSSQHWDICQRFQTSRTLAARADFAAARLKHNPPERRTRSSAKQHQDFAFWNIHTALSRHFLLSFCRQVVSWPPLLRKETAKNLSLSLPTIITSGSDSFCWYFWGNGGTDGKQMWPRLIPIWSILKRKGIILTIAKTIAVI